EAEGLSAARVEAEKVAGIATQEKPRAARAAEVKHAVMCTVNSGRAEERVPRARLAHTAFERKAQMVRCVIRVKPPARGATQRQGGLREWDSRLVSRSA